MKAISFHMIFSFLLLTPSLSWSNSCFIDAVESGNLSGQDLRCVNSIIALHGDLPGIQTGNMGNALTSLEDAHGANSTHPHFETLSKAAAQVYYHYNHCGYDNQAGAIQCNNLRRLSLLHPTGFFAENYNCPPDGNIRHCRDYVRTISQWLDSHKVKGGTNCDQGNLNKHYCKDLVGAFLNTEACNGSATESKCQEFLETRFVQNPEKCSFQNYRDSFNQREQTMGPCAGMDLQATQGDIQIAGTPDSGFDDTTATEEPADDPNQDLNQLTDQVAQEVFAGSGLNNLETNLESTNLNVPNVDANNLTGSQINTNGGNPAGAAMNTGRNSQLSPNAFINPPTQGAPGGTKKENNGAGGAPGGIGGGGAFAGGRGGLPQAPGGSGKRRRRGGGRSRFAPIAESMGQGYMGTDMRQNSGGPAEKETPLQKKIRKQIAKNEKKQKPVNLGSLQKAFRTGLSQAKQRDLLMKASLFPEHTDAYIHEIRTNRTLSTAQGDL